MRPEIVKSKSTGGPDEENQHLIVDGIKCPGFSLGNDNQRIVHFYEEQDAVLLGKYALNELKGVMSELSFPLELEEFKDLASIEAKFYFRDHFDRKAESIYCELRIDWENWSKPWSINDFADQLRIIIDNLHLAYVVQYNQPDEMVSNGFGPCFCSVDTTALFGEEKTKISTELAKLLRTVIASLNDEVNSRVFAMKFNFPEEYSTACKQYLMYFAQFLEDLGIRSQVSITSSGPETLLKVDPEDKGTALQNIRESLEAYLQAPMYKFASDENEFLDISISQLQANIMHLKSQLALANAQIMMQASTIGNLSKYISMASPIESTLTPRVLNDEPESMPIPIAGGALRITKYSGQGFEVDIPAILRRMKRKIWK